MKNENGMRTYKQFIVNYEKYVTFVPDGKENPVIRRLYKMDNEKYYFRFNNEKVIINSDQLHW